MFGLLRPARAAAPRTAQAAAHAAFSTPAAASLGRATSDSFAPFVGSTFFVRPAVGPAVPLVLTASADRRQVALPANARRPPRTPFSLIFQGPGGAPLSQDTYVIVHPVLGTFPLFIVPIGMPQVGHVVYEAAFG